MQFSFISHPNNYGYCCAHEGDENSEVVYKDLTLQGTWTNTTAALFLEAEQQIEA